MKPIARLPGILPTAAMWLFFYTASVLMYTPFLGASYFSDDLLYIFTSPPSHLIQYFRMPGVGAHVYRPADAIILTLIQQHFGLNTVPIHLLGIGAHASLCCMVWLAALSLGLTRFGAMTASVLMLVAQVSTGSVLGNDTMSQAMSAAFATLSYLLFAFAFLRYIQQASTRLSSGLLSASALAYFAGLTFKETGSGVLISIALLTVFGAFYQRGWRARFEFLWRSLLPYGLVVIVYLALRFSTGQRIPESGNYHPELGLNTIRNLVQFAVAALDPISTVSTALAVQNREVGVLALICAATLLVSGMLVAGLLMSSRKTLIAALIFSSLAGLFPAFVLPHVSEIYLYNAMPYVVLLFGLAFTELWSRGNVMRGGVILTLALCLGGQISAIRQKASLLYRNGETAGRLIKQINGYMRNMPPASEILLAEPPNTGFKYSVYILPGLNVLDFGYVRLGPMSGRPDVKVRIVDEAEARSLGSNSHRLILELRNGSLEP